ncbi:hypothetical protein AKJ16_DCAP20195 [Drosera capensis]
MSYPPPQELQFAAGFSFKAQIKPLLALACDGKNISLYLVTRQRDTRKRDILHRDKVVVMVSHIHSSRTVSYHLSKSLFRRRLPHLRKTTTKAALKDVWRPFAVAVSWKCAAKPWQSDWE